MDRMSEFLTMGGFAGFVWPAYAVVATVLAALFVVSRRRLAAAEAELAAVESAERSPPREA